jgi:hypothetical protein
MKTLTYIISVLTISLNLAIATIFTNPPVLVDRHSYPLSLPFGEVPPIVGTNFVISSPDRFNLFSFETEVSGFDGPLLINHSGYIGFNLYTTDIGGWPLPGEMEIFINGKSIGVFPDTFFATDEPGTILILPWAGLFATINSIEYAFPAPNISMTLKDGIPTVLLRGRPSQVYGLCMSDTLDGTWTRIKKGNLDSNGVVEIPVSSGKFFRAE